MTELPQGAWAFATLASIPLAFLLGRAARRSAVALVVLAAIPIVLVRWSATTDPPTVFDAMVFAPVFWAVAAVAGGAREARDALLWLGVGVPLFGVTAEVGAHLFLGPMAYLQAGEDGPVPKCGQAAEAFEDAAEGSVLLHIGDSMPGCDFGDPEESIVAVLEEKVPDGPQHVCMTASATGPDWGAWCLDQVLDEHGDKLCGVVWYLFPGNDLLDVGAPSVVTGRPVYALGPEGAQGEALPVPADAGGWWRRAAASSGVPQLVRGSMRWSLAGRHLAARLGDLRRRWLYGLGADPRGTADQRALVEAILRRMGRRLDDLGVEYASVPVPMRDLETEMLEFDEAAAYLQAIAPRAGWPPVGDTDWRDIALLNGGGEEAVYVAPVDPHFSQYGMGVWADHLLAEGLPCGLASP